MEKPVNLCIRQQTNSQILRNRNKKLPFSFTVPVFHEIKQRNPIKASRIGSYSNRVEPNPSTQRLFFSIFKELSFDFSRFGEKERKSQVWERRRIASLCANLKPSLDWIGRDVMGLDSRTNLRYDPSLNSLVVVTQNGNRHYGRLEDDPFIQCNWTGLGFWIDPLLFSICFWIAAQVLIVIYSFFF